MLTFSSSKYKPLHFVDDVAPLDILVSFVEPSSSVQLGRPRRDSGCGAERGQPILLFLSLYVWL